jgi:ABC-2 type transport system permease protein
MVAPVAPRTILLAKIEAALLPVAALVLPVIVAATLRQPWLGATIAVCAAGSALTFAMLQLGTAELRKHQDFAVRRPSSVVTNLIETLLVLLWLGVASLMLWGSWFALALALLPLLPVPRGILALRRSALYGSMLEPS